MPVSYWETMGLEDPLSFNLAVAEPERPVGDDRTWFARANDFIIDVGNTAASFAQAGASLVSPGGDVAQSIGDFIKGGEESQSDYRKRLREEQQRLIQEAKEKDDTGALAWLQSELSNPITSLLPKVVGNMLPFAAMGRVAQGLGAASAAGRGAVAAEAAGSQAALGATSGLGATVGAGGVRQGYFEAIQNTPDDRLLAENPDYARMRQSMSEADAKRELGSAVDPRLAGGMAVGGLAAGVAGRFGTESALFGRSPAGALRTAGVETGTEAAEEAVQQGAQNVAVQARLPSQSLTEGIGLAATQGAVVGAPGGLAAGVAAKFRSPPSTDPIADIGNARTLDEAVAATSRALEPEISELTGKPLTPPRSVDPVMATAADDPVMAARMSEDKLRAAQAQFNETALAAQAVLRQQAFEQEEAAKAQGPSGVPAESLQAVRQAEVGAQEQVAREQGLQQMAPTPPAAPVEPTLQGPMQLAMARLKEKEDARRSAVPDAPGSVAAVPRAPIAAPKAAVDSGVAQRIGPASIDGLAGGANAGQPVAASPVDGVRSQAGTDAVERLNVSLASRGKGAVVEVTDAELPVARTPAKDGRVTLSQKEAIEVRRFGEIFGKKVVFYRGIEDDGATSDNETIYVNADAKSAHHLVVAGHELGHQMRKDSPELFAQLRTKLGKEVQAGNIANFLRTVGIENKAVYQTLDEPLQLEAATEEFIVDLIGNRAAEYKTALGLMNTARKSKDANLLYKVGQYIVSFIDGLLAKVDRKKYGTDRFVKDLEGVRVSVRAALESYAQRSQGRAPVVRDLRMRESLLKQLLGCMNG